MDRADAPAVSGKELGGIAKLAPPTRRPGLAGAARRQGRAVLPQTRPAQPLRLQRADPDRRRQTINDQFTTGGPNYREFFYALTGFAGESQNFDGNGPLRALPAGGGDILVGEPRSRMAGRTRSKPVYAITQHAAARHQPQLGADPPKKPGVRCDKQPVPDVNSARQASAGAPTLAVTSHERDPESEPLAALPRLALAPEPRAQQGHDRDRRPGRSSAS